MTGEKYVDGIRTLFKKGSGPLDRIFRQANGREASFSGRGQWVCALRRPATDSGAATIDGKTHSWKVPYKSLWLRVPVPARYEAYFSFYTLLRVFLKP